MLLVSLPDLKDSTEGLTHSWSGNETYMLSKWGCTVFNIPKDGLHMVSILF